MSREKPSDQRQDLRRQAEEALRQQPPALPKTPTRGAIRILYIDDKEPDRLLVRDALRQDAGQFHLTEAGSRAEFEARLAEGDYDLVLTDLDIGDIDGLQVLETVKAKDPRLPVVIVTGSERVEMAVEAMKRGAADYVIKRLNHIRRLPHTIRAALEYQSLLHELQVHQVELEMQNAELRRAQVDLEKARDRYLDLYEFAPVGYVTLSEEGIILEANLTLATMLGVERGKLLRRPLSQFVFREDQDTYYLQRRELFRTGEPQAFEVRLVRGDGTPFWARIEGRLVHEGEAERPVCRAAISDISARVQAEEKERLAAQVYATLSERRPGEALERVFELLGKWLPVDNAALFIVSEGEDVRIDGVWVRPGWEEAQEQTAREMYERMAAAREAGSPLLWGAFGEAIRSNRPVYLPDLRQRGGASRSVIARHGLHSAYILPLISRRELHILVCFSSGAVDALSEAQRSFIEALRPTLTAAVEAWYYEQELKQLNADLERKVRQRTFELGILYELAQQLGYTLNYDELFRLMVEQLHRVVNYDVAATVLIVEGLREVFVYPLRPLQPEVEREVKSRLLKTFASMRGEVLDVNTLRMQTHPPLKRSGEPVAQLGSVFMVPLVVGEAWETVGMLLVAAEAEEAFDEVQVRLLYTVAHQARVSIQRLRALLAEEQRRLESVVEHLPAGVLLLDAHNRVVLANPRGRAYLSALGGYGVGSILGWVGDRTIEEVLAEAVKTPVELRLPGEEPRILELRARKIEEGRSVGEHVLTLRDVTRERQLLAAEQARRQELDALYGLARQLVANDDLESVSQTIARRAVEIIHVTFSRVLLLEGEEGLVCCAAYALHKHEPPLPLPVGSSPPPEVQALFQQALRRTQPWLLTESAPSRGGPLLKLFASRSLCLTPLRVGEEAVGLLLLGETRELEREPFDAEKLRLTAVIADQAASALRRARLYEELSQAYLAEQAHARQMAKLVELGAELNRPLMLDEVIAVIGKGTQGLSGTGRVAVYVRDNQHFTCRWRQGISGEYVEKDTSRLLEIPDGAFLTESEPILISDVLQIQEPPWLMEAAREEGYRGLALWPLVYRGRTVAVVACYYDGPQVWSAREQEVMQAFTTQAAIAVQNASLYEELEEAYVQTVMALSKAMDARDAYTGDHSQRMAAWAEATARELECDEREIEAIRWAALLHDIGKIGVPDEILRKPGELDEAEWEVIKRHPVIGAEIVAPVKRLAEVAPIIRAHQEKYDGSGYPDGLKGEEIPLGARILAVVDAYGAIIDERPYKEARSHEEAVAELRRCAGTHFDPRVVEAFLRVLERGGRHNAGGGKGSALVMGVKQIDKLAKDNKQTIASSRQREKLSVVSVNRPPNSGYT